MSLKFPADFDKCVREGGRVRTITPKKGTYIHVCWDKAGKSHSGEVKHTEKEASEEKMFLINQGYVEKNGEYVKGSSITLKKLIPQIDISGETFKETESEIEVLHEGKWEHPQYGIIQITDQDIDKFVESFNSKVRKVDIAVDQEHMPEKGAAGWVRKVKKVVEDGKSKMKASVEWTKLGAQLIKDGIFKYFSPEFDFDYEDLETHEKFENVLIGGALTNRPYFKSLAPVALSENIYASFTGNEDSEKGGENKMTKEELKAKLAEDSAFVLSADASEEDKKVFEEAKAELAKDAADKEEADRKAAEEAKKKEEIKASEKQFISRAEHDKQMNELKSQMGIVESKLRFKEVQANVQGYVFTESNVNGVILAKNVDKAVELMMAASPKVAKLFTEFLASLPKVSAKLFEEQGGDKGEVDKKKAIEAEAGKLMSERKITYGNAIKVLAKEKPELFK